MKLLGDVSERDKEIAKELTDHEKWLDSDKTFSAEKKAQTVVCLAHDWFQLGMEEEGSRLLYKADTIYPGYFKNKLFKHAAESKDFDALVKNMTIELMYVLLNQFEELQRNK